MASTLNRRDCLSCFGVCPRLCLWHFCRQPKNQLSTPFLRKAIFCKLHLASGLLHELWDAGGVFKLLCVFSAPSNIHLQPLQLSSHGMLLNELQFKVADGSEPTADQQGLWKGSW